MGSAAGACQLIRFDGVVQGVTFPYESPEYRAARNKLLHREVALRREIEAVAAEIRALTSGGVVPENCEFDQIDEDDGGASGRAGAVPTCTALLDN